MSNSRSESGGVQSVDRAVSVLEILAHRGEAGVSEVAADIGEHKSTAFRLLGALEDRELVEQTQERGKYRLGFGILRMASAVAGRLDVTQQARPVCERPVTTVNLPDSLISTLATDWLPRRYTARKLPSSGPPSSKVMSSSGPAMPAN